MKDDREAAQRVAPLGAVITNLCDELKMHHVARLSKGECGLEENKNFTDIDMNEVVFHRIDGKNPYIELAALKELKKEKTSQDTAKKDEKYYWIQQYDDESQTPVVITVYEK